jgi:hypothetical protein
MKALTVFLMMAISLNSFSMICTSEDNFAKKLAITSKHNGMVTGESYIRTYINVFAGTVQKGFLNDTYKLFNQEGQEFTLTVKKEPFIQHCRTRVCPPIPAPTPQDQVGKLSFTNADGEEVHEYFECL